MNQNKNDWWCETCEFMVFGTKPKCLKCGEEKPKKAKVSEKPKKVKDEVSEKPKKIKKWKPGNTDPKWDRFGPFSCLKGGLYGEALDNEPKDLEYPTCGCNHLQHCPQRHHIKGCKCYTCRGKSHKW